nr:MAG TPA: hypothetical protein [Crassvirales sp.]
MKLILLSSFQFIIVFLTNLLSFIVIIKIIRISIRKLSISISYSSKFICTKSIRTIIYLIL